MIKPRRNIETVVDNGRELVQVSVNGKGDSTASIWKDDYVFLTHTLKLNPNWTTPYNRKNVLALGITNSKVSVARCLLDADVGQIVRYKDGNGLNLRRENLLLLEGDKRAGKRRDRNFIRFAIGIEERPSHAG